jgi:hypothetical protein
MLIALGIVSLVTLVLALKIFRLMAERKYLDVSACVEQARAQIATELLYEGTAKHHELSFDETCRIIESIRKEPSMNLRVVLADVIINGYKLEPQVKKHIGF